MDPVFHWVTRIALAILFASAAHHKSQDLQGFGATLREYRILPSRWVASGSVALAASEGLLALLFLSGFALPMASAAAVFLLAVYSAAIGVNLLRGRRQIDCGCLGPAGSQPLSAALLVRNAILGFGAALVFLEPIDRSYSAIDLLSIAGGTATLVLLFSASSQLVAQASSSRQIGSPS